MDKSLLLFAKLEETFRQSHLKIHQIRVVKYVRIYITGCGLETAAEDFVFCHQGAVWARRKPLRSNKILSMQPWEASFSPLVPLLAREEIEFRKAKKQKKVGRGEERGRGNLEEVRNKISKRVNPSGQRLWRNKEKLGFSQAEQHRHFLYCVDFCVVLESWKSSRCQVMSL